ncbi:MAG: PD40 domain-containing protein [Chthonomonadetes bacterium]|nr:PD40 domain-containing protein [Chthonomonadetes bacterium]
MFKNVLVWCSVCLSVLTMGWEECLPQQFRPPLSGREILLEASGQTGKTLREGIWAYNPETDKLRLLIEDAKTPLWNPQHTLFAFAQDRNFFISDRAGKRRPIEGIDFDEGELLGWSPDGTTLFLSVAYSNSLYAFPPTLQVMGLRPGFSRGIWSVRVNDKRLVARPFITTEEHFRGHHIGALSFSPDGKRVAFEVYRAVPEVGRLESRIAVAEVLPDGELRHVRLLTRLPSHFLELNPHWSPDGEHIALDVVDTHQQVLVPCIVTRNGALVGFLVKGHAEGKSALVVSALPELRQEIWSVRGWISADRVAVLEKPLVLKQANPLMGDALWIIHIRGTDPPIIVSNAYTPKLFLLSPDKRQVAEVYELGYTLIHWLQGAIWRSRIEKRALAIATKVRSEVAGMLPLTRIRWGSW